MLTKDPVAKEMHGYTDPESFVRNDGSEVLFGDDWRRRRKELWERSGGQCEYMTGDGNGELSRCQKMAEDPHHIKPRSQGKDDRLSNLMALCRGHHYLIDRRKVSWKPREGDWL